MYMYIYRYVCVCVCVCVCVYIYIYTHTYIHIIGASLIAHLPAMQETRARFLDRKNPLRRKWQPTPVFLPGESHRQRSLTGYSPWDGKRRTQLSY